MKDGKLYKRGRLMVIIVAALEYFIQLCVTTTLLTAILNYMNVTTALQGTIAAIVSLANSVQIISVFAVKKTYPCKRWVNILNLFTQLCFAVLYCIPQLEFSTEFKTAVFIFLLLLAYVCKAWLSPSQVNWQMSLVDDNHRGRFTAKKEMISLVGGIVFSQAAGIALDYFKAKNDMRTCFVIFGITITVLALSNFAASVATPEPEPENTPPVKKSSEIIKAVFGSPELRRVTFFDMAYVISTASSHFISVYLVNTLGFSYTYIAAMGIGAALTRTLVSPYTGRLADKKSWAFALKVCMLANAAAFTFLAVANAKTCAYFYPAYLLLNAFSMSGSNGGRTNLCLDYAKNEDRRYIFGIMAALSGLAGFLTTLLYSAFVDYVEKNSNTLFGIHVYPQQVLLLISAVMMLFLAFVVLPKLKKPERCEIKE